MAASLALAHGWKYLMAAATAAALPFSCAADAAERRAEYEATPRKHTIKRRMHGLSLKSEELYLYVCSL